jgi:hypothetical protein
VITAIIEAFKTEELYAIKKYAVYTEWDICCVVQRADPRDCLSPGGSSDLVQCFSAEYMVAVSNKPHPTCARTEEALKEVS